MNQLHDLLCYNRASGEKLHRRSNASGWIWNMDVTFQQHIWEYLSAQRIYQPLLGDVEHACQHCREWKHWQGYTDSEVYWIISGGEQEGDLNAI